MEGSSEKRSELDLESESRDYKQFKEFLDLEVDSIGSWAEEVDSDMDAREAESGSAGAIKFNPKYAFQARKLKESLPASSLVGHHDRGGQNDHRPREDRRSYSPSSPSKYRRNSYGQSSPQDGERNHRQYNRRSGSSYDDFYRRPQSSDSKYRKDRGSRYSRDRGRLSPLRSPLNSRPTSVDQGNRRQYRRSFGETHSRSQLLDGIDENCETTRKQVSPPSQTNTVLSDEDEASRRRLCLPEDESCQTNGDAEMEELTEDDEDRLARREKDIVYGKNTDSYQKYIQSVPYEFRHEDSKIHPRTPLKTRKCSRRSWDAQIRIWKRRVHSWAAQTVDSSTPQQSEPPVNGNGTRWADVVAGTSTLNGHSSGHVQDKVTENTDPNEDDDDSFLEIEGLDLEFDCNDIPYLMDNSSNFDSVSAVENPSQDDES